MEETRITALACDVVIFTEALEIIERASDKPSNESRPPTRSLDKIQIWIFVTFLDENKLGSSRIWFSLFGYKAMEFGALTFFIT